MSTNSDILIPLLFQPVSKTCRSVIPQILFYFHSKRFCTHVTNLKAEGYLFTFFSIHTYTCMHKKILSQTILQESHSSAKRDVTSPSQTIVFLHLRQQRKYYSVASVVSTSQLNSVHCSREVSLTDLNQSHVPSSVLLLFNSHSYVCCTNRAVLSKLPAAKVKLAGIYFESQSCRY